MSKYDLLKITAKNIGLRLADNLSAGMGSAISDSIKDIQEYSQKTNEALYYFQIRTFLETADIDQEEVNNFFQENPNNLRLGIEIFKILEQTVIEEQAKMLARAFSLWVRKKYKDRSQFDMDIYLIKSLDSHLLTLFKEVGELRNDGVDATYNSQHLEHLSLVIKEKNPIINGEDEYQYQASQLGKDFYERILK